MQIIGVYTDSDKRLVSKLEKTRIGFPVLQDNYSIVARRYDVTAKQVCHMVGPDSKFVQHKTCKKAEDIREFLQRDSE